MLKYKRSNEKCWEKSHLLLSGQRSYSPALGINNSVVNNASSPCVQCINNTCYLPINHVSFSYLHWINNSVFKNASSPFVQNINNAANKIFISPLRHMFMLQINHLLCGNLETHCWLHIWKENNTFERTKRESMVDQQKRCD